MFVRCGSENCDYGMNWIELKIELNWIEMILSQQGKGYTEVVL